MGAVSSTRPVAATRNENENENENKDENKEHEHEHEHEYLLVGGGAGGERAVARRAPLGEVDEAELPAPDLAHHLELRARDLPLVARAPAEVGGGQRLRTRPPERAAQTLAAAYTHTHTHTYTYEYVHIIILILILGAAPWPALQYLRESSENRTRTHSYDAIQ